MSVPSAATVRFERNDRSIKVVARTYAFKPTTKESYVGAPAGHGVR